MRKALIILFILSLATAVSILAMKEKSQRKDNITAIGSEKDADHTQGTDTRTETSVVAEPISNSKTRITKKPFGLKVSPTSSPINPERFSGFHTGTDFELLPTENNDTIIEVRAVCTGRVIKIQRVSGYGGVLVQECAIDNQSVTVVYGHIQLSSATIGIGDSLEEGAKIAVLGTPGPDTDGERKHLHLGIHKGSSIDWRGYTQSQSELGEWLDYQALTERE